MLIFVVIAFPLALYKGGVLNHRLSVSINEALRAVEILITQRSNVWNPGPPQFKSALSTGSCIMHVLF